MIKAILFRFAAVLISLLIVALFGEVALRVFAPGLGTSVSERTRFCRFDHDLGWVPRENITWRDNTFLVHQINSGCAAPVFTNPGEKQTEDYITGRFR